MEASFKDRYLFYLVHGKGLLMGRFRQIHYGQWGEDIILNKLFSGTPKGFFVDVGAYHPMHYSNTYLLYKRGWNGVNIDPNPNSIRLFNWHRRRDININRGVSEKAEKKTYYMFNHQSCNTFSREQRDVQLQKSFIRSIGEIGIPCEPLRDILARHARGREVDLLNIDVEGMGLAVLHSLDWEKTKPEIICIEDDDIDLSKKPPFGSDIYQFLQERSYSLHSKVGLSCIYARNSHVI